MNLEDGGGSMYGSIDIIELEFKWVLNKAQVGNGIIIHMKSRIEKDTE